MAVSKRASLIRPLEFGGKKVERNDRWRVIVGLRKVERVVGAVIWRSIMNRVGCFFFFGSL